MQEWNNTAYGKKIRRRIAGLWALLAGMLVYMVIISELGGGDHRAMSSLAQTVSRVIFFGGMAFVGYRIYRNKKLLRDRQLFREAQCRERDERNQYLHDKSGGLVTDILLVALLLAVLTCALFDMEAFYATLGLLLLAAALKGAAYWAYSEGKLH